MAGKVKRRGRDSPRFAINLCIDEPNKIPPYHSSIRPFSWRLKGLGLDIWWNWFGGWLWPIGPTVRHAGRALAADARYLERGEGSYYLSVYQSSSMWGWRRIPLLRRLAGLRDEEVAELHNPRPGTTATYLDDG